MLQNFRCYQAARALYREACSLPLRGELRNQFDRALLSVVLNLAEGSGKSTGKERARFYSIALGSLREVQAIFEIVGEKKRFEEANVLGAMIFRLIQRPG